MRTVVVGMGVQGPKRVAAAGGDVVATVDPVRDADFRDLKDVPADSFDAAILCVPDEAKLALIDFLIGRGKHIMVEKPLLVGSDGAIDDLLARTRSAGVVCYTAYNHRFEPHFMRMKTLLDSGELGRVYTVRMFYGNGTARLVRDSAWRDRGSGVLHDLGSHLLDTMLFWFGRIDAPFRLACANRFENASPDHVVLTSEGAMSVQLEMTLLSWRNHFTCDVLAEKGSAHIESLCKWGPSVFRHRRRMLPSGRPPEESVTLVQDDPTWTAEYAFFKQLCQGGGEGNLANDLWLTEVLFAVSASIRENQP